MLTRQDILKVMHEAEVKIAYFTFQDKSIVLKYIPSQIRYVLTKHVGRTMEAYFVFDRKQEDLIAKTYNRLVDTIGGT